MIPSSIVDDGGHVIKLLQNCVNGRFAQHIIVDEDGINIRVVASPDDYELNVVHPRERVDGCVTGQDSFDKRYCRPSHPPIVFSVRH